MPKMEKRISKEVEVDQESSDKTDNLLRFTCESIKPFIMDNNHQLISLEDAAYMLGYKNVQPIKRLIKKGIIKTYIGTRSTRLKVKLSEVLGLAVLD
jgi:hypothetical protein